MFNKSKFIIKRFISSSSSVKTTFPPFKYRQLLSLSSHNTTKPFKSLNNSTPLYSPFSTLFNWHQNKYKKDIALLKDFPQEKLAWAQQLFDEYAASQDLRTFSLEETKYIVSILQHLSEASQEQGEVNQADSYLNEAEEICQKLNLKNTKEAANNHFIKASLYLTQDFTKTEKHLDEAERVCWLFDDDEEMKSLIIHIDFARAFLSRKRNENDKALEFLNSVLEKTGGFTDKVSPDILLITYRELGFIYAERMDYDKAKEYLPKALKMAIDYFGEYSQQAFQASSNLFKFYSDTQKDKEAFYYAKKNLQIASQIFAKNSVEIGWCYCRLGDLYMRNQEFDKALESYEEAIKRYEKSPQEYSKVLNDLYYRVSSLYHLQGKSQEASAFFMKSTEMLTLANVENDPDMIGTYLKRTEDLKTLRRLEESEGYLRKCLKVCQGLEHPLNRPRIVDIHFSLGEVLYEKQDWDASLQIFKETEKLLKECSTESFTLYVLYSYLGALYVIIKDFDKAVNYLEKAVGYCEMVGDIGFLMVLYGRLGDAYKVKGMEKEREEVLKKLGKYTILDQTHPKIQAGIRKAYQIFWIIQ